jgi:hypothetical protein
MRQKAVANDICGTKLKHPGRLLKCRNRFSRCCAWYIEHGRMKRRRKFIDDLKGSDLRFAYYLSIEIPAERTTNSVRAFHKAVRSALDKILPRRASTPTEPNGIIYWEFAINGFRGDWIVGTAVVISEKQQITITDVRRALRAALGQKSQISVFQICTHSELPRSFSQLFRIIVPEKYEEQVSLEIVFHRLPMTSHIRAETKVIRSQNSTSTSPFAIGERA